MPKKSGTLANLNGSRWRATHQQTVDGILGPGVRPVISRGSMFYNKDNWTARTFVANLCEWARLNRNAKPTRRDVQDWVYRANNDKRVQKPGIVIASTPDDLPRWLAMALVGGGYHEAWHTYYSRLSPIRLEEVWPKVQDMWDLMDYDPANGKPGWAGVINVVLHWSNIIEDIRIERCGCREFPGAPEKMVELQDLILKQERAGEQVNEHRSGGKKAKQSNEDLTVTVGVFRDLGLGYTSPLQKLVLREYFERSPTGWRMVKDGVLRPYLDRAIALGPKDDMDSLWMAMEIVAHLAKVAQMDPPEESEDGEGEGEQPSGPPQVVDQQPEIADEGQKTNSNAVNKSKKPVLFKVGNRATLKEGPYKGRVVEVTWASLPDHETGKQDLRFALVDGV